MTVAELLQRISSRELTEWMALAEIEPFGEERADWRAAMIAATFANTLRGEREPYPVSDFLLDFEDKAEREDDETWKAHLAMVEMLNVALGGEDKRQR